MMGTQTQPPPLISVQSVFVRNPRVANLNGEWYNHSDKRNSYGSLRLPLNNLDNDEDDEEEEEEEEVDDNNLRAEHPSVGELIFLLYFLVFFNFF